MKLKERWVATSVPYCTAPNENHPQTHRVIFILYLVCLLDLRFSSITEKRASVIFLISYQLLILTRQELCKGDFLLSVKEEKIS